jgi:hypothetical protein
MRNELVSWFTSGPILAQLFTFTWTNLKEHPEYPKKQRLDMGDQQNTDAQNKQKWNDMSIKLGQWYCQLKTQSNLAATISSPESLMPIC